MGFLGKLFGKEEEEKAKEVKSSDSKKVEVKKASQEKSIPPEKVGIDGKFDESGLAKRVALALDEADISDQVGLWVAQRGDTVVLKYNEDAKSILDRAESVAKNVDGANSVETVLNT